ncbi:hypothetical protein C8Q73DRAFT_704161, partial [Cubamyces lactineus]
MRITPKSQTPHPRTPAPLEPRVSPSSTDSERPRTAADHHPASAAVPDIPS